ncbi:MAG TPA: hypothetical protein VFE22_01560, partial [Edaphobacter sp.]|nr:hypothetical protein [Edaphobacter sp.]
MFVIPEGNPRFTRIAKDAFGGEPLQPPRHLRKLSQTFANENCFYRFFLPEVATGFFAADFFTGAVTFFATGFFPLAAAFFTAVFGG